MIVGNVHLLFINDRQAARVVEVRFIAPSAVVHAVSLAKVPTRAVSTPHAVVVGIGDNNVAVGHHGNVHGRV